MTEGIGDNRIYKIREVVRDGQKIWKLECPGCGLEGSIDEDQYYGRVSVDCADCEFHETIDFSKES